MGPCIDSSSLLPASVSYDAMPGEAHVWLGFIIESKIRPLFPCVFVINHCFYSCVWARPDSKANRSATKDTSRGPLGYPISVSIDAAQAPLM